MPELLMLSTSAFTRAMVGELRSPRRNQHDAFDDIVSAVLAGNAEAGLIANRHRRHVLHQLEKVRAEWAMICIAHNLLKLANATR